MNFVTEGGVYMVKETAQFFRKNLLKLFLILFGMAVLLTVVFYMIYSKNPADAIEEIQSFKMANAGLMSENNTISFWGLFFNNIKAGAIYIFLGFVAPLSLFIVIVLAKSLGAALVYSETQRAIPVLQIVFLGILPHGIFEWSAVFLCIALGLYIGTYWIRKKKLYEWRILAKYAAIIYFSVIVPLMFIAAFVETFITTQLSNLM